MSKKRKSSYIGLVLLTLLIMVLIYSTTQLALLSISKVEVQGIGHVDTTSGLWTGQNWVITMTGAYADQLQALKFDSSNLEGTNQNGEALEVKSSIEISINPLQPYMTRGTKPVSYTVYPEVYQYIGHSLGLGTGWWEKNTNVKEIAKEIIVREWSDVVWDIHTPFEVVVKKNGVETGRQTYDPSGHYDVTGDPTFEIGGILFENLGLLINDFSVPTGGDPMVMFSEDQTQMFEKNTILSTLEWNPRGQDASLPNFGTYWWGNGLREGINPTPIVGDAQNNGINANLYPGWEFSQGGVFGELTWFTPKPAQNLGINTDLTPDGIGIIDYIRTQHPSAQVNLDSRGAGWDYSVTSEKIRVNIALGDFNPLFIIRIPTELADTVVYNPIIGSGEIVDGSAVWASTGSGIVTLGSGQSDIFKVYIKNTGTIASSFLVGVSFPTQEAMGIEPDAWQLTDDIPAGSTLPVSFKVTNNGPNIISEDVPVHIVLENTANEVLDEDYVYVTLQPAPVAGDTKIELQVIELGSALLIDGLSVSVEFGSVIQQDITEVGMAYFNLGTYIGQVTITSAGTEEYKYSKLETSVTSGTNYITLYVEPVDYVSPMDPLLIILLVAVALTLSGGGVLYKKRKKLKW